MAMLLVSVSLCIIENSSWIHSLTDFVDSYVAYNLDSPTVSLEHVFFPSVTICNMNTLRRSFITSLLTDEQLQQKTNFQQLKKLINNVFITGSGKDDLSNEEKEIINSKSSENILQCSTVQCSMLTNFFYKEF